MSAPGRQPRSLARRGAPAGTRRARPSPAQLPYFLEGGTPNVLGVAGLAAGLAWVVERGVDASREHEVELLRKVVDWVDANEGWRYAGRWEPATHVGALSLIVPEGLSPHDIAASLDSSFDIAVRPGLHCSPYVHKAIGTLADGGTLRVSPGPFTTEGRSTRFSARSRRSRRGCSEVAAARPLETRPRPLYTERVFNERPATMPEGRPRPMWGWTGPARGMLILALGVLSASLAWSSRPSRFEAVALAPLRVDPNSAPASVLAALPGLGPVLSGRIVEARGAGPFRSADDLDRRVKGIGPVKSAALKPFLRFEPE